MPTVRSLGTADIAYWSPPDDARDVNAPGVRHQMIRGTSVGINASFEDERAYLSRMFLPDRLGVV
jgi:hypothetical protein